MLSGTPMKGTITLGLAKEMDEARPQRTTGIIDIQQ
jgi:hypothetical protein